MNPIVPKAWVTLDARFLREDIIVLAFEVGRNLREAAHILISGRKQRVDISPPIVRFWCGQSREN